MGEGTVTMMKDIPRTTAPVPSITAVSATMGERVVKHYHKGKGHLYNPQARHMFEEEYGKKRGDEIFGKVVGKVKRERARKR